MNRMQFISNNFRWLFAGFVLTFASCFGQTFFISVFAEKIMNSYSLSHGEWGRIYGIGTLCSGILLIWAGGLADRFRIRHLAVTMLVLMAGFTFLMAVNPFVWLLPFIIFGLRFCGQGMLFHIAMVGMARWFSASRGKAISISVLGFSLGEAFLPMLFVSLMGVIVWNKIWIATGLIALLLIPLIIYLLASERKPTTEDTNTSNTGIDDRHWTRRDAIRHPLFWCVAPSILAPSTLTTALYFQQVHLSQDKGWAHLDFVALFPFFTGAIVISMLFYGWAVDKFKATRLIPYFQLPMAAGFFLMANATSLSSALVAMILIAIMQGGNSSISVAFWAEAYGTRHVGSIKAMITGIMVFGSAIGPAVSGWLIDRGITFSQQMPTFSVLICIISLITFLGVRKFGPTHSI